MTYGTDITFEIYKPIKFSADNNALVKEMMPHQNNFLTIIVLRNQVHFVRVGTDVSQYCIKEALRNKEWKLKMAKERGNQNPVQSLTDGKVKYLFFP